MFLTMRAYEQIRVDVAYQNLPVVLAGVIPGYGYGNSGTTHHSIEDAAILRVLPNMTVVYTSCETDVRAAARQAVNYGKPIYIGLGRNNPNYQPAYMQADFQIGKAIRLTDGSDAALFATGVMLTEAMGAYEILKEKGIHVSVYNMHTVKPLDVEAVLAERSPSLLPKATISIAGLSASACRTPMAKEAAQSPGSEKRPASTPKA